MTGIQKIGFEGHLDMDSDPTKVVNGNYVDGKNLQFLTGNTESTKTHIPMLGNEEAFSLGTTLAQNKTWRITTPQDATNDVGGIFLYDQNGNLFPTISGQAQPMEWNRNQSMANQVADILALFTTIDGTGTTVVTTSGDYIYITTDTIAGYDIGMKATTTTGATPLTTDTSLDPQVYQEAYDDSVNGTGKNQAIGSFDLLGDLYIWSTAQTQLPTIITPTITTVTVSGGRYRVTTSADHGLTSGWKVAISGVNIGTPATSGVSPNGLWIITVVSATVFDCQEWYDVATGFVQGAAGGNVQIYTQGVGILGVAQFDANSNAWTYTEIAKTIQWNFTTKKQIDTYAERNAVKDSIYWTDDYNVPRCLYYIKDYNSNGVLQPFVTNGAITLWNASGLYSYLTINQETRLQLSTTNAQLSFIKQLQAGGQVASGNWRYAIEFLTSALTATVPSDLTNPVNVCVATLSGNATLVIGDEPNTITSKINQLEVTGILPGLFKYVQLIGVNYVGDSVVGYVIKRELLSDTQTSIILNHTGTETGVTNYDLGLLNQKFTDIATAKNIDVIDKRMILSNLTSSARKDLSAWAQTFEHVLSQKSIDSVGNSLLGTLTVNEYQIPENVNNYVGYMQNETYRFGVKVRFKNGVVSDVFHVDDIIFDTEATNSASTDPTRRISGLPNFNLSDFTGAASPNFDTTTVYVPYIQFASIDMDYLIDGVRIRDLIDSFSIVRAEVTNPTILACGYVIPSIEEVDIDAAPPKSGFTYNGNITYFPVAPNGATNGMGEFPFISGRAAAPANPHYDAAEFAGNGIDRKVVAFYSPDIQFGHTSIDFISGDALLNHGNAMYPNFIAENSNPAANLNSQYAQWTGYFNTSGPNPGITTSHPVSEAVYLGYGQDVTLASTKVYKKYGALFTNNSVYSICEISPSFVIECSTDLNPFGAQTDWGFYYCQYYRALSDQYGDTNLTQYVTCGHLFEVTSATTGFQSTDVFGGDTFTQLNYMRNRTFAQDLGDFTGSGFIAQVTDVPGFGGAVSFYCQNRINAQMKQKSLTQTGNLYPGITTVSWLESPSNTDGNRGEAYQEGYTIRNEVQSDIAFDSNLENTNDFPARIIWSAIKPQGSPSDQYRVFLPLNFHDLDQTFGEIVHHANANGELTTWQQRAFMRQYFNTRGTLEVQGITEILIGDGSVMSRDGVTVSRLGCKHKWAIIKGKSDGGNDTFYWINTELKKALRFGYDGTVSVADIKDMRSWFANNLKWVNGYDTPADGWGICGVWDDRFSNAIWSFRARRTTPYTYSAAVDYSSVGQLVFYNVTPKSTFEQTGELFLLKVANGPSSTVITPVAVYLIPYTISTITGTTVLTITTSIPHKLVTGDQVVLRFISGLSTDINNTLHTVTVTGASTFTITVAALQNNYVASSGQVVEVVAKYWEFIPHTDPDYWNEYSLIFSEIKNAFTFFTSPKPKIYLKWTDSYLTPRPIIPENKVYLHNKGSYLTWYLSSGESQQEQAYIQGVMNEVDGEIKWAEAIAVESSIIPPTVEFVNTSQESFLTSSEFTTRNRDHYSPIKQDSTGIGVNDAGTSLLYDEWMKVKVFFSVNVYNALKEVVIKFRVSVRYKNR